MKRIFKFFFEAPVYLFFFRTGRRILMMLIVIFTGLMLFHKVGPQHFRMSSIQKRIGSELVEKAVKEFPWDKDIGTVMMISDSEAWAPYFTDSIRERVSYFSSNGSRKFDILPDSFPDRLLRTLGFKTTRSRLSDKQIARICKGMGPDADTLLIVRFSGADYVEDEKKCSGRLECVFYPKSGGEPLRIVSTASHSKQSRVFDGVCGFFERMSMSARIVWAVMTVVLFPFLMAPVTMIVIKRKSAQANALMIAAYSIVLLAFGWVVFPTPQNALLGAVYCVVGTLVVWYILKVSDMVASPDFRERLQSA